ncbi:MAG: AI-2E family transporter, partial [Nanoarchaeota archaeon]|nr:AI-2E family transporter [Nanoarchaeota archaeon]
DNAKISENLIIFSSIINSKLSSDIDLNIVYNNFLADFDSYTTEILFKIPFFIFHIFIVVFFYYYFSRNYNDDILFVKSIIDIKRFSHIAKQIGELINGVIYGQIIVRFIQALIATIFFLAIGIDGAILFGVLTFFVAFIPIFGASLVWFPLSLIYFLADDFLIAVLIIGIGFIVSTVDNFLLPFFISNKTNLGPVMTLISIIGGIQLLGFYGIVLGPFFLGLFFVFLEEVFSKMKSPVPLRAMRENVWTEEERTIYRNLKTDFGRKEYKRILGLSSKSINADK